MSCSRVQKLTCHQGCNEVDVGYRDCVSRDPSGLCAHFAGQPLDKVWIKGVIASLICSHGPPEAFILQDGAASLRIDVGHFLRRRLCTAISEGVLSQVIQAGKLVSVVCTVSTVVQPGKNEVDVRFSCEHISDVPSNVANPDPSWSQWDDIEDCVPVSSKNKAAAASTNPQPSVIRITERAKEPIDVDAELVVLDD
eukprot:GDKI01001069.1.p1 GENE.GDKI01001069.1~~GDKI01001069.1.p1  ORF type:complete len:196 (-),score=26.38 GDKI01001069.1:173-760(-)